MTRIPPMWKIRREAHRVGLQLLAQIETVTGPWKRARHERTRAAQTLITQGPWAAEGRIAIFLVFQPAGVASSIVDTCHHLIAKGYAPLIVSNGPLNDTDRAALAALSWRLIERPNFGHDFGGYREGVQFLTAQGVTTDSLIIMNDSTWFPAVVPSDLIDRMEASSADMTGAQVFQRRVANGSAERPMVGSYFMMFRRAALGPAFHDFWRDYRLTSNRQLVLRDGERALSHRLGAAGVNIGGIQTRDDVARAIDGLDDADMARVLRYAVCADPDDVIARNALLSEPSSDAGWTDDARVLLHRLAGDEGHAPALPVLVLRHLRLPFVKKNAEPSVAATRAALARALADDQVPGVPGRVAAEIAASVPATG